MDKFFFVWICACFGLVAYWCQTTVRIMAQLLQLCKLICLIIMLCCARIINSNILITSPGNTLPFETIGTPGTATTINKTFHALTITHSNQYNKRVLLLDGRVWNKWHSERSLQNNNTMHFLSPHVYQIVLSCVWTKHKNCHLRHGIPFIKLLI